MPFENARSAATRQKAWSKCLHLAEPEQMDQILGNEIFIQVKALHGP